MDTNRMKTKNPHLDTGCPGKAYFEKRDAELKPMIREAVHEALGDVPKHMKMAGENRMWLYFLTAGLFITGVILLIV
jgi:hypothetical protein